MAMVPGTITNSHILLAVLQQLRAYCSLPATISNSYALHRYRLSFTATKFCLLPAAGSTFFSWSGVTLWSMLVSACSSSRPHRTLRTFKSLSFHPLHRIVFHLATREENRGYIFFFWVCNISLLLLLFLKDLDGICIYLRLLTFSLFAFFTRLLLTFVLFFLFYLLAVVPRSG